ncbi:sulfite exporter TauE/SafE family protein [Promicromonospora thailandica]|uniref:Probable membrane transporter protein n=1 Tax=Promicromonospora thailandica TaxID=765201 RepID=A0A9X2JUE8_9MICO|nr:sulfite exporter TauE/SafE family protein [Promicromonospora thailandica]MCP2263387.1 hypothetical protein [Promicromonospora thailandica]BFF19452.1 sulfite exporter TauE/SafE family protein [Promicromonospora thailandica]
MTAQTDDSLTPPRAALVGVVGGAFSGLFGLGGGIVMVPLLTSLGGLTQRRASAYSLAAILPAAIVGSIPYLTHRAVDLVAAGLLVVGSVVGAVVGARLLARVPETLLRWLFVGVLVAGIVRSLLDGFGEPPSVDSAEGLPSLLDGTGMVGLGLVMGIASGLLGIGGGQLAVPGLSALFDFAPALAKGTSLVAMIPTAVSGTWVNARNRLVHLRTAAIIGLVASVFSFGGASLSVVLPDRVASVAFAALLVFALAQQVRKALEKRPR